MLLACCSAGADSTDVLVVLELMASLLVRWLPCVLRGWVEESDVHSFFMGPHTWVVFIVDSWPKHDRG